MAYHLCFHCGEVCDCGGYDGCDGCGDCAGDNFDEEFIDSDFRDDDYSEYEFSDPADFDCGEDE